MALCFMEGNEAIAWGAFEAGCRFFAGYPITPATTIYNTMLKLLPPAGGICLQAEDEIASIGFCLGASMAGMKVLTATSGPGISLYSEQISFAVGSEIPLVVIDVQRLGPSTGSATRGADGDVQFLRWGNSGGLPVIVLAPVDVADCFTLTMEAFNLAEIHRCPVFVATNKEIAMTRESVDWDKLHRVAPVSRRLCPQGADFLPFRVGKDRLVPDFLPIGSSRLVRQTSSTHGPDGYITTDPDQIGENQKRLLEKIESQVDRFTFFEEMTVKDAETLVVCYGVTARAAKVAVADLQRRGHAVSLLVLKTLWPVPAGLIADKAVTCRRVVMVEMNMGQYVREIERVVAPLPVVFYGQMNGELVGPEKIMEVITHG